MRTALLSGGLVAAAVLTAVLLMTPSSSTGLTPFVVPSAPSGVAVSAANTSWDYAIVNWTNYHGYLTTETGYDVNVSTTNCTGSRVLSDVGVGAANHYNMTGLIPSTAYGVKVTIRNATGFSAASACVTFTTLSDANFPLPPGTDTALGAAILGGVIAAVVATLFTRYTIQNARNKRKVVR